MKEFTTVTTDKHTSLAAKVAESEELTPVICSIRPGTWLLSESPRPNKTLVGAQ